MPGRGDEKLRWRRDAWGRPAAERIGDFGDWRFEGASVQYKIRIDAPALYHQFRGASCRFPFRRQTPTTRAAAKGPLPVRRAALGAARAADDGGRAVGGPVPIGHCPVAQWAVA
nr:unnamed protein product [Digitaria exilis]